MNAYDAAHALARALKEAPELEAFQEAQAQLKNDPSAREMLIDFRTQQLNLQRQQFSGLEIAPEQEEKLEKLYQVISMNLSIKRFMEAEYRAGVLLQDIQKIIAEATGSLLDAELLGMPGLDELENEDGIE
jgi:cell fate (sporulation/competence/biofilm development) regulator YlbF (YheA/YmcA/DUF963 family)